MKSRAFLIGTALLVLAGCKAETTPEQTAQPGEPQQQVKQDALEASESAALAELEKKSGGRLGVYILDTGTGKATGHRADEHFALASTFKLSLAALILKMADEGKVKLDEKISFTKADMVNNSPVIEAALAKGSLTVEELARGTQETSDNAAANLLMKHIGGPHKVTEFWRSLGDEVSNVDGFEPAMNDVPAGDKSNTTSPSAMAHSMAKFVTGDTLSAASKEKLISWMVATETGKKRIRAGLPSGWRAGDKTGTYNGIVNDIAVVWVPGKSPLIVTAYYNGTAKGEEKRAADQATLAEVGRIAAEWVGK